MEIAARMVSRKNIPRDSVPFNRREALSSDVMHVEQSGGLQDYSLVFEACAGGELDISQEGHAGLWRETPYCLSAVLMLCSNTVSSASR